MKLSSKPKVTAIGLPTVGPHAEVAGVGSASLLSSPCFLVFSLLEIVSRVSLVPDGVPALPSFLFLSFLLFLLFFLNVVSSLLLAITISLVHQYLDHFLGLLH